MNTTGLIHIYTGDGKGKTTSAIGLACRALGGGLQVLYASFHKRPELFGYTEMESLRELGATVLNFAKGHPHLDTSITRKQMEQEVRMGLKTLSDRIAGEHFDLLILDEILISVRDQFIPEAILLDFIAQRPAQLELVLTGRAATEEVMKRADYVSHIQKIKHPYDRGVISRKGIEF